MSCPSVCTATIHQCASILFSITHCTQNDVCNQISRYFGRPESTALLETESVCSSSPSAILSSIYYVTNFCEASKCKVILLISL